MPNEKHPYTDDPRWFDIPQCLSQLWSWLEDQGTAPSSPAYFMEKPYKWAEDWEAFLNDYNYGEGN